MSAPEQIHFRTMLPGERFRVGRETFRVVPGDGEVSEDGEPFAFEDDRGRRVPGAELAHRNGTSYFVLPVPSASAAVAGKGGGR